VPNNNALVPTTDWGRPWWIAFYGRNCWAETQQQARASHFEVREEGFSVLFRRLAFVALVCAVIQGAFASAEPASARGGKHAAMILDANSGNVLHAEDADELRHPASLTKMMTLYLTFETIHSGRLSMSDKIKISQEAASQAPSKLDLEPGEEITVQDAIRSLITKSANDVAVALAERVGGSEKNFVRLMNTRARELGMSKTHFENASGLPNSDQVTTARDMITLGLRLQDDYPTFYPLFATRSFSFNRSTYRNHNTMLNTFQGIDGIKTGYTSASGFNLVSSVRRGDRHVIGAVFGGSSAATRNGEMRMLLTRALARAATVKTRKPAPSLIAKLKSAPKIAERPKAKEAPKQYAAQAVEGRAHVKPFAPAQTIAELAARNVDAGMPVAKQIAATQRPAATPTANVPPLPVADAEAELQAAAPAPVDVFKVKRVMVAPRQGPKPPRPNADQMTDMASSESAGDDIESRPVPAADQTLSVTPPALAATAAESIDAADPIERLAKAEPVTNQNQDDTETVIPKTTVVAEVMPARRTVTNGTEIAMLGARDIAASVPAHTADVPANPRAVFTAAAITPRPAPTPAAKPASPAATAQKAPAPVETGRAPSSLQAQARQLPQRVASQSPTDAGRFEIQIGAYSSIDEAQRALNSAQSRAGNLLAGAASVTHPVVKSGRQVYRARFAGFDSARASSTCTELRRQAIDCFVMTAD
jgi:D-alanyl-D-alanine carboxypeptidase